MALYEPAGHALQFSRDVPPGELPKNPGGHCSHCGAPGAVENEPGAHAAQLVLPAVAL